MTEPLIKQKLTANLVSAACSPELRAKADEYSEKHGIKLSALIRHAVSLFLESETSKRDKNPKTERSKAK